MSWVTTEAVHTKSQSWNWGRLYPPSWRNPNLRLLGAVGSITRLKEQTERLFSCSVSCRYHDEVGGASVGTGFTIAKEYRLWWHPKSPVQAPLWKSTVTLSTDFLRHRSKPCPGRYAGAQGTQAVASKLDIYCWLTYPLSYLPSLRKSVVCPANAVWGGIWT
ncbi:MAG: hypothetical protein IPL59_24735 [Candidatus Competibacteraceae bacterium]|nr:hypothetical protein [Candidatus Competibacteraceae bacterium]